MLTDTNYFWSTIRALSLSLSLLIHIQEHNFALPEITIQSYSSLNIAKENRETNMTNGPFCHMHNLVLGKSQATIKFSIPLHLPNKRIKHGLKKNAKEREETQVWPL